MRGSDSDGLRRNPPVGRHKSRLSGVVLGMICGVVVFGGMLVVLNEIAPKEGRGAGSPEVSSDDIKSDPDAPAISLSTDDTNSSPDDAGPEATSGKGEDAAATTTPPADESAKDASSTELAADNTASTGAVSGDHPTRVPAEIKAAPEIKLAGPANRINARNFNGPPNAGLLSVVLYGGSDTLTAEALSTLAMPLTLAIRADRPQGIALAESAVGLGYEVLAVLPLAVADQNTAGRLKGDDAPARLENGAAIALASMRMAVGAVAPVGAQMLDRPEAMAPLLKHVAAHSFLWVEPQPSSRSAAARMAADSDLIFLQASVFAGPSMPEQVLAESIETAAQQARARGTAVLFLEASQEAMRALWKWSLERREPGVVLAPISAVAKKRGKG